MEPIIATIKLNDSGAKVANLIECLLLLIERGVFKTFAAPVGQPRRS